MVFSSILLEDKKTSSRLFLEDGMERDSSMRVKVPPE